MLIEERYQGLVVYLQCETLGKQVVVELVTPNTQANASLLIWEYLRSTSVRECDIKAIGRSDPSCIQCDSTVLIPYEDASQASSRGRSGSKWTKTSADVNNFLAA